MESRFFLPLHFERRLLEFGYWNTQQYQDCHNCILKNLHWRLWYFKSILIRFASYSALQFQNDTNNRQHQQQWYAFIKYSSLNNGQPLKVRPVLITGVCAISCAMYWPQSGTRWDATDDSWVTEFDITVETNRVEGSFWFCLPFLGDPVSPTIMW